MHRASALAAKRRARKAEGGVAPIRSPPRTWGPVRYLRRMPKNFTKLVELPTDPERRHAIVTEIVATLQEGGQPYLVVDLRDGPTPDLAVLHVFSEGLYPRWFYPRWFYPRWWPMWLMPMHPLGFVTWLWTLAKWRWLDPRNTAQ